MEGADFIIQNKKRLGKWKNGKTMSSTKSLAEDMTPMLFSSSISILMNRTRTSRFDRLMYQSCIHV